MKPSEILDSVKKDIPFYVLDEYINNLIADENYKLAGTEESMLASAISYYSANGNPNRTESVAITVSETESTEEIDFPSEFASVIQIKDNGLNSVPYETDTATQKIKVVTGPPYYGPYELRYRFKIEDYFAYSVDGSGIVTIDTDKDIDQVHIANLIKRLLKAKLSDYNRKITEVSQSVQMELPISETQGEKALAEEDIKAQVRIQPSLFN